MSDWRPFVFGGVASVVAECVTFPIDTSKTRLQVQGQVADGAKLRYKSLPHALITITREEGARKLYSGLKPAVLRQATYGTLRIGLYHTMKKAIGGEESLEKNIFCGVTAGAIASCMCNPTDVLKIRMQASGGSGSLASALYRLAKDEGVKGLWRGVVPNAQRAAVVAGVELPVYDRSKRYLINAGWSPEARSTHFTASFVAGFAATVFANPVDVMKTRMMNQSTSGGGKIYSGVMDCFLQTVRHEGPLALYRGFNANWLRLGPWTVVFFMTFEQLKLAEGLLNTKY